MLSDLCNSGCTSCALHQRAKFVCVPGKGAEQDIRIIITGEAPGPDENRNGECFIGKAGVLLEKYIDEVGIDRKYLRLENLARCWPQDDSTGATRQPTPAEVSACLPYFYTTLMSILSNQDTVPIIIALGNVALESLTGNAKITKNRGVPFDLIIPEEHLDNFGSLVDAGIKVIGTIHPSAVVRGNESFAGKIVSDLTLVWNLINNKVENYWSGYKWIDDPKEFERWVESAIDKYKKSEIRWVAYDLETTGLEVYDTKGHHTVCFSLCCEDGKGIVVPLLHKDNPWKDDKFITDRVIATLGHLLNSVPIAGWGITFDVKWTKLHLNLWPKEIGFDGLLARRWLYGSDRQHDLNSVASEELSFFGHGNDIWSELKNLPKELQTFANVSKDTLIRYAAGDADATFQLSNRLYDLLVSINSFDNFKALSLEGVLPVCEMEIDGVFISEATNKHLSKVYPEKMSPLMDFISGTTFGKNTINYLRGRINDKGKPAPLDFNLASDVSLRHLIFKEMKMPVLEMAKTGPVADREVVDQLIEFCNKYGKQEERKVLESINEWRTHKHTYANFIKNVPTYTQWDGFFHTQYNIAGTDTGRFSSSKPSIHGQQKGSEAREQFISRWSGKGGLLVSADQAQMEVRVLAALAKDKNLIETIKSGVDLHTANASRMYKVPIEEVTKKLRDHAKRSSFGVIYGIGPETLAARLECTVMEAQQIIEAWYDAFPGTLMFQRQEYAKAQKYGYVMTNFGRFRSIEDIKKSKWGDKAWRRSINTNIQSTASDITYTALLELKKDLKSKEGMKSKVFGFVHDSIIADVFPGELWEMMGMQRYYMMDWANSTYGWMEGLVKTDFEICTSWGLPCSVVSWNGDEIKVKGPTPNVELLMIELQNHSGTIITEYEEGEMESTMGFTREIVF